MEVQFHIYLNLTLDRCEASADLLQHKFVSLGGLRDILEVMTKRNNLSAAREP
jgi:hypothetical protein